MSHIHPTAVIDPAAKLGSDLEIGPYCTVGPHVSLGDGVKLVSHVIVDGHTTIGAGTTVYPYACVGLPPQDQKFGGEVSYLEIGSHTIIREHATLHPGTTGGGLHTRVGDNCLIMVGAHVAHDCHIGNDVILVNNVTLGGHVEVHDFAIIGGLSAVHQFARIGKHAMIGGMSGVENDVIPYGSVVGNRARLGGLNLVGLRRRQFPREQIQDLRNAYRLLFAPEGTMEERLDEVERIMGQNPLVQDILTFIRADTSRALCQPRTERGV